MDSWELRAIVLVLASTHTELIFFSLTAPGRAVSRSRPHLITHELHVLEFLCIRNYANVDRKCVGYNLFLVVCLRDSCTGTGFCPVRILRSRKLSGAAFSCAILVVSTLVDVGRLMRYCLTLDSFTLETAGPMKSLRMPVHTWARILSLAQQHNITLRDVCIRGL